MEKAKAETLPSPGVVPNPKARPLDQVREVIRAKHYSIRTEEAYVQSIKQFILNSAVEPQRHRDGKEA